MAELKPLTHVVDRCQDLRQDLPLGCDQVWIAQVVGSVVARAEVGAGEVEAGEEGVGQIVRLVRKAQRF